MPYVAIGTIFMVNNFRAVAMDSRLSFFISMVAFIALTALGEGVSCHLERDSEVFVCEYVFVFQGSSFSEFHNFCLISIYDEVIRTS